MPKMKSKKAISKRVKIKKSGKVQRSQAYTSHLFSNKSTKSKRQKRKEVSVSKSDIKRWKDVLRK